VKVERGTDKVEVPNHFDILNVIRLDSGIYYPMIRTTYETLTLLKQQEKRDPEGTKKWKESLPMGIPVYYTPVDNNIHFYPAFDRDSEIKITYVPPPVQI
jgi:hypothetical protein